MMVITNIKWSEMSDAAIIRQLGAYIRGIRLQQNRTQAQLAEMAGLNRWTINQIEKGESITLVSLIQILRALDSLHTLHDFEVSEDISPLEYAKLKRKGRKRARPNTKPSSDSEDLGW